MVSSLQGLRVKTQVSNMMLSVSVGWLPLCLYLSLSCLLPSSSHAARNNFVTMTLCHHSTLYSFSPKVYSEGKYVWIVRTITNFISSSSTDAVLYLVWEGEGSRELGMCCPVWQPPLPCTPFLTTWNLANATCLKDDILGIFVKEILTFLKVISMACVVCRLNSAWSEPGENTEPRKGTCVLILSSDNVGIGRESFNSHDFH